MAWEERRPLTEARCASGFRCRSWGSEPTVSAGGPPLWINKSNRWDKNWSSWKYALLCNISSCRGALSDAGGGGGEPLLESRLFAFTSASRRMKPCSRASRRSLTRQFPHCGQYRKLPYRKLKSLPGIDQTWAEISFLFVCDCCCLVTSLLNPHNKWVILSPFSRWGRVV